MTREFPTAPLTQITVNIVVNDSNLEKDGFQRLIIGTAIADPKSAQSTITHSSRTNCDMPYTQAGYNPMELSAANSFLSKKKVEIWPKGSK
mmetsp:Transcript_39341/g.82255  ORF Transcript_39341/g.82255 Transcript_39341/m.82255 type:complete len:91 (-) Transcript_39341:664-936(-)